MLDQLMILMKLYYVNYYPMQKLQIIQLLKLMHIQLGGIMNNRLDLIVLQLKLYFLERKH